MNCRMALGAVLVCCASALTLAAVPAAAPPAGSTTAAELIEKLGLHVAAQPVRERPGWRPPQIVLINKEMLDLRPALQQAAPRVKLIEVSAAPPKELAAAHAA